MSSITTHSSIRVTSPISRDFVDGSDGIEPATFGVTGHFWGRGMHDDGLQIALFMRCLSLNTHRSPMVERKDFRRLLPECCTGRPIRTLPLERRRSLVRQPPSVQP